MLRPYLAELLCFVLYSDGIHGFVDALGVVEVADVSFRLDMSLDPKGFVPLLQRKSRGGRHRNHVVLNILLG